MVPAPLIALHSRLAGIFARVGVANILAVLLGLSLLNTYADVSFKGPLGIGLSFEGWKPKARRLQGEIAAAEATHAVTRASLAQCADAHAAYIDDGVKRRKALERALERQESHSAALGRQIERIRTERAPARAPEAVAGVCETPQSVLAADGL